MANVYLSHLHHKSASLDRQTVLSLMALLSEETQHRVSQQQTPALRHRSLLSKLMLYQLAQEVYPYVKIQQHPLRYGPKGQPFLEGVPLCCSVSYQDDWITVAVSDAKRMGVDVETTERNLKFNQLPGSFKQQLANLEIRQWNELEAYAKYWNEGLSILFRKPLPTQENLHFVHRSISNNIDCCIAISEPSQLQQKYIKLVDLVYHFINPFSRVFDIAAPVPETNSIHYYGKIKQIPTGRISATTS